MYQNYKKGARLLARYVMRNNQAREYFTQKGLSYENVTSGDICVLVMILNKKIKIASRKGEMSTNTMHLSEKVDSRYKSNGQLINCYIYISSDYFSRRECISFNTDGFIGFCGWASERNTKPIVEAFIEWCDYLEEQSKEE